MPAVTFPSRAGKFARLRCCSAGSFSCRLQRERFGGTPINLANLDGPTNSAAQTVTALRTSSNDSSPVRWSPHCTQSAVCRQDRIRRLRSALRMTVKVSAVGSTWSSKYGRHAVETDRCPTSMSLRIRRKRIRSVSKIQVL
jgi:hypothetical protein